MRHTLLLLFLLVLPSCRPSPPTTPVAFDRLEAFIAQELADKDIPALSIAVVDAEDLLWSKGFGSADAAGTRPVTGQTVYRVASVSKLITALAVMRLVERGAFDLDVPVHTYLPSFFPNNPYEAET